MALTEEDRKEIKLIVIKELMEANADFLVYIKKKDYNLENFHMHYREFLQSRHTKIFENKE